MRVLVVLSALLVAALAFPTVARAHHDASVQCYDVPTWITIPIPVGGIQVSVQVPATIRHCYRVYTQHPVVYTPPVYQQTYQASYPPGYQPQHQKPPKAKYHYQPKQYRTCKQWEQRWRRGTGWCWQCVKW